MNPVSSSPPRLSFMPRFFGPTETLFSLCARYALLSGKRASKPSSCVLLGHRRASSLHDMPVGLGHLHEVSEGLVNPTLDLLRTRTGLAAVWPFTDSSWQARVLVQAIAQPKKGGQQPPGLRWNVLPSSIYLRHCEHCLAIDIAETGAPIWRNEHQLPGVWVCLAHNALLTALEVPADDNLWALPGIDAPKGRLVRAADLERAAELARAVSWISAQSSLTTTTMSALVRNRLAQTGFATTDITATDADLNRFNEVRVLGMRGCVPPLTGLPSDSRWIREVLADKRALHPAKWGVLLAASGDCAVKSLDRDLREAQARVTHQALPGASRARRLRAPDRLYEALKVHQFKADASAACGMSVGEADRWLRRDPALKQAWREAKHDKRKADSRVAVLQYLSANPGALRSEVYLQPGGHVRWLLENDRCWIESVLPRAVPHLAKQGSLEL